MSELTYEDYKRRVNIQEVLRDAGYVLNRRDGLRYPSYVRLGSDGRRVRGDKFIVTANGLCCFQPPERKNYNVISFIKEHPGLFSEYTPGMSKDRLVNLVCRRLLNLPPEERILHEDSSSRARKPFDIHEYETHSWNNEDWESKKKFYPYFKNRGIDLYTQRVFSGHFFLATKGRTDGKKYTNLSFPMSLPACPGKEIVGLEERSRPNADGKTAYKGMAAGSNATDGLWIARLENHHSDKGVTKPIGEARDVYWFESAFDAMAYYQLRQAYLSDRISGCMERMDGEQDSDRDEVIALDKEMDELGNAVFVSTGGSPSQQQFKGMLKETPNARHHLCFDRDRAGQVFAVNFALTGAGRIYSSHITKDGNLVVLDSTEKYQRHEVALEPFDFGRITAELGIDTDKPRYPQELAEYVDSLTDPKDIFSGDTMCLSGDVGKLYGKYESMAEEYYSESHSGLVCKEDLAETKEKLTKAYKEYREAMQKTFAGYMEGKGCPAIRYEQPENGYKDWNDQLLDKKMETAEEKRDENSQEEQRNGFRR